MVLSTPAYHPQRHQPTSERRAVPVRRSRSGVSRVAMEAAVVTFAALLYFFVRGLMETRVSLAFDNADRIISIERALGIFHEPWLQQQVLDIGWLATLANRVYIFGHWPVIAATLASRSLWQTSWSLVRPAGTCPGQRAMNGTRSPPSNRSALCPRSGPLG